MARIEQQAYVIHLRPWKEQGELIECFTPDYGRLPLLREKASPALPRFQEILVECRGRAEQKTLTAFSVCGSLIHLQGMSLYSAMYLNELIYYLVPRYDASPLLYGVYSSTLHMLAGNSSEHAAALRYFEKCLLEVCGYGITWQADLAGQPVLSGESYFYQQGCGFSRGHGVDAIPGDVLLSIGRNDFSGDSTLFWARRIQRQEIDVLLAGRELNSRKWAAMSVRVRP